MSVNKIFGPSAFQNLCPNEYRLPKNTTTLLSSIMSSITTTVIDACNEMSEDITVSVMLKAITGVIPKEMLQYAIANGNRVLMEYKSGLLLYKEPKPPKTGILEPRHLRSGLKVLAYAAHDDIPVSRNCKLMDKIIQKLAVFLADKSIAAIGNDTELSLQKMATTFENIFPGELLDNLNGHAVQNLNWYSAGQLEFSLKPLKTVEVEDVRIKSFIPDIQEFAKNAFSITLQKDTSAEIEKNLKEITGLVIEKVAQSLDYSSTGQPTITERNIISVIRNLFPREVSRCAFAHGLGNIVKFHSGILKYEVKEATGETAPRPETREEEYFAPDYQSGDSFLENESDGDPGGDINEVKNETWNGSVPYKEPKPPKTGVLEPRHLRSGLKVLAYAAHDDIPVSRDCKLMENVIQKLGVFLADRSIAAIENDTELSLQKMAATFENIFPEELLENLNGHAVQNLNWYAAGQLEFSLKPLKIVEVEDVQLKALIPDIQELAKNTFSITLQKDTSAEIEKNLKGITGLVIEKVAQSLDYSSTGQPTITERNIISVIRNLFPREVSRCAFAHGLGNIVKFHSGILKYEVKEAIEETSPRPETREEEYFAPDFQSGDSFLENENDGDPGGDFTEVMNETWNGSVPYKEPKPPKTGVLEPRHLRSGLKVLAYAAHDDIPVSRNCTLMENVIQKLGVFLADRSIAAIENDTELSLQKMATTFENIFPEELLENLNGHAVQNLNWYAAGQLDFSLKPLKTVEVEDVRLNDLIPDVQEFAKNVFSITLQKDTAAEIEKNLKEITGMIIENVVQSLDHSSTGQPTVTERNIFSVIRNLFPSEVSRCACAYGLGNIVKFHSGILKYEDKGAIEETSPRAEKRKEESFEVDLRSDVRGLEKGNESYLGGDFTAFLNETLNEIADALAVKCSEFARRRNNGFLTENDVMDSTKELLPRSLGEHAFTRIYSPLQNKEISV